MGMRNNWPDTVRGDLASDNAHVWAVPLAVDPNVLEESWSMLAANELERAKDFRFAEPRQRFVIARRALRSLLGGYLGIRPTAIQLTAADNGKPRLAGKHAASDLHFNVSHSGDLALIILAVGCEVGADVEHVRDVGHMEQIARRFFHPAETKTLLEMPAADRSSTFLRCWTGKEAVLKAFGTGITGSLSEFEVPLGESWQGWIQGSADSPNADGSRCWLQQLTPCDGYVGAVACVESQRTVRRFMFSA
jgi:4'-phosphopantetheinyl transferase